MSQLEDRLAAHKANLDEAVTELTGLNDIIAQLRAELEANGFTPAAAEFLTQAEAAGTTLKDLVTPP